MHLKQLPAIERPREKLLRYGVDKLSDGELLAILLRTGKKGENVILMANKILKKFSGQGLHNACLEELTEYPGLGPAKAAEIVACFELGRRRLKDKKTTLYLNPESVWESMKDIRAEKKEHFVVFFLDTRNQEIKREIISIGTLNASLVHPREVFEPAVICTAAHIIVSHNHPSGNPEPSGEDLELTKRLIQAGKIMGIELTDHVIVAKDAYVSLRERGII